MENQKQKGRPPKEKGNAKRQHFSVWVSADQKRQINELIEKSGLSASQFFLTLALDVPFQRPQKRALPRATAETVRVLQRLSGVLSLAALKTNGHQMLSDQWQQSSQRVRLLADLITLWVFEGFEIRSMKKVFEELHAWSSELTSYLSQILPETEGKHQLLLRCSATSRLIDDLQQKYEAYYSESLEELAPLWRSGEIDGASVHAEIEKALTATMKRMKL
ncbi:plasmid mobilization protein [Dyadobacter sp. 22481]|uniref:plasmid mobilization protein n=1 Tax=Dyadobacter sp. 22481 TaxID=3453926 RepID=UPI003F864795